MTDHTMGKRKTQSEELEGPQPRDQFAVSRALDAAGLPQLEGVFHALIDDVTAISGNSQVRAIEAIGELRKELTARATEEDKTLVDVRYQLAQIVGNHPILIEHLTRQDTKLEALSSGQQQLRGEFSAVAENVSDLQLQMHDARGQLSELTKRVGAQGERLDRKRIEIDLLKEEVARQNLQILELKAQLAARPTPEKAHATYDGVQRILTHLGLDETVGG